MSDHPQPLGPGSPEADPLPPSSEQLQHADRLATVGRLAASIIHELGTPLNVVKVRAQMIAQGEVEGAEARESAEGISQQVDRISAIIRQLLDYARAQRPAPDPIDLDALVRDTAAFLAPVAMKHRTGILVETLSEGPFLIEGTRSLLQQVLVNLVTNAFQALTDGGTVTIQIEHVEATPPGKQRPHPCIRLAVLDDGPGIAEEIRTQIFEPFFTTKAAGAGTGLGLAVCAEIVQDHGGWMTVDSRPGGGTCFRILLPL